MSIISSFFSKMFRSANFARTQLKRQDQSIIENKDNEALRTAARNAVLNVLQNKHEINPEILKIIEEYNEFFFRAFCIPQTHYKLKFDQKDIIVQVNDKNFHEALSKSDKLSICYEHILLRLIQKEFKNFDYRLFLQAGDSAKQHYNYLTNLASKLAAKVLQTGHKVTVLSKSSYERSILHGVIKQLPGVTSKSIGPYHQRRLVIYPEKNLNTQDE